MYHFALHGLIGGPSLSKGLQFLLIHLNQLIHALVLAMSVNKVCVEAPEDVVDQ